MADARNLQLCAEVVTLIETAWDASATPRGDNDGVQSARVPTISFTPDSPPQISGRQVFVFPQPWSAVNFTRADQLRDYRVRVLVVEQYGQNEGEEGPPPDSWVDTRIGFCETIFNLLANPSLMIAQQWFPALEEIATVDVLYDEEYLLGDKAFWSLMTFPFQEETLWTGGVES